MASSTIADYVHPWMWLGQHPEAQIIMVHDTAGVDSRRHVQSKACLRVLGRPVQNA